MALTAIGFDAAHVLIPPVGSPTTLLARFATLTVVGMLLELLFLRLGRIKPLIIGHLMIDMLLIGGFALKSTRS